MSTNFLKLNADKTEVIVFGSDYNMRKYPQNSLKMDNDEFQTQSYVRNLGALFDSTLSMDKFVSDKCKTAMYYLRSIRRISRSLDTSTTKTLVHAMVTSRIDFSNSLLLGVNKVILSRLQKIQNCAARLIVGADRWTHITPILKTLHWLPIDLRIKYKILMICFRSVHGLAPTYLSSLVSFYKPSRMLRSHDKLLLSVPSINSKYGEKRF